MEFDTSLDEFITISRSIIRGNEMIPFTFSLIDDEGQRKLYLFEHTDVKQRAKIWDTFAFILNIHGAQSYSFLYQTEVRKNFVGVGHVTKTDKDYLVFRLDDEREMQEIVRAPDTSLKGRYFELFQLSKQLAIGEKFPIEPKELRKQFEEVTFSQLLTGIQIIRPTH